MPKSYYYAVHNPRGLSIVVQSWSEAQKYLTSHARCKKFHHLKDAEYYSEHGVVRKASESLPPNTLHVYTDGSAQRIDGLDCAGSGVFFGHHSPLNIAEPLPGTQQTSNRAELYAIRRALEILAQLPGDESVVIFSDSTYARKCLGEWRPLWVANNFGDGQVKNRDLIEPLWSLIDASRRQLRIEWSSGHAGIAGNEAADALANSGARAKRDEIVSSSEAHVPQPSGEYPTR